MTNPRDPLLDRVGRSSTRMRIAMAITAVLCLLIAAGIASDSSITGGTLGWKVAGALGVVFFLTIAVLLIAGALWRQRRHVARLQQLLAGQPERIRSIKLLVARTVPYASWSLNRGTAATGLHVSVTDDTGTTWLLPVSRDEANAMIDNLARRCPQAVIEPPELMA